MRSGFVACFLLFALLLCGCLNAQETSYRLRPALDVPLRDASVCRGPEGNYYMTGTSAGRRPDGAPDFHNNDGIYLWQSPDLRNWQALGKVWDITGSLVDARGDLSWLRKHRIVPGQPDVGRARGVQAPEIHYLKGTFWIAFSMNGQGTGLLKSSSGKAEGPYEHHARLTTRGGDASLFQDDDGTVYWLYGEGWIARMEEDMRALAEQPRQLRCTPDGELDDYPRMVGSGGPFLLKRDGVYYLMMGDRNGRLGAPCHDTFVAWSRDIYGPYGKRVISIAHGGQTTVFTDGQDNYYATFYGDDPRAALRDSPAIVPLEWASQVMYFGHTGQPVPRKPQHVVTERGPWLEMRPVSEVRMRDVQAMLGPDGYVYLTGSIVDEERRGEFIVWRSRDLQNWEERVIYRFADIDWVDQQVPRDKGLAGQFMDSEIHYINGTFWAAYSVYRPKIFLGQGKWHIPEPTGEKPLRGTALLKSVSGTWEGPWEGMGPVLNGQASFFVDDDGTVYHTYGPYGITRMKPDMSAPEPGGRSLLPADGSDANEDTGGYMAKMEGRYVQFVTDWNGPSTLGLEGSAGGRYFATYDYTYYYSDSLHGSFSSPRVGIPHGGHGSVFKDRLGNWWATTFGNDSTSPWSGMAGVIPLTVETQDGELLIDVADAEELLRRWRELRE